MDLSAQMFYKVKFSIAAKEPSSDLLWKIVRHVKKWQTKKWNKKGCEAILPVASSIWTSIKNGGRIITDSKIVYIESEFFSPDSGNTQLWACRIIETPPVERGVAPRTWTTEIGYEYGEGNAAVFSCVLSYEDRAGFIGPYQDVPNPSIPWLIKNIVNDPELVVTCGSDKITGNPLKLDVGDWPQFLMGIEDEQRQLPYIYISPKETDRENHATKLLLDPVRLASVVYGNAVVFYSTDIGFTSEVSYMNPEYACYNGGIKVYQPGAKETYQHHSLGPQAIEENGPDCIIDYLRRAFSQNVNFYDSFFRIEDCRKKKAEYEQRKRFAEQIAHYKSQLSEIRDSADKRVNRVEEETLKMLEEEERQRLEAEADRDEYKDLYEKEKTKVFGLVTQTELMRAAMQENEGLRRSVESRSLFPERPCDIADVVKYFEEVFSDRIIFSDDAKKSLKYCEIDVDELWRVLFSLSTVMWALYRKGSGDIYSAFKAETGIDCARGEGTMTRKDRSLMRQYETSIGSEAVDIEAHITYAKQGQSIHFGYSSIRDKVVVGHCGEHLDNYTTRKVK